MNPFPAKLFDLVSAAVEQRLRVTLFGAAMTALGFGLTALFAALAIGFGAFAAYAALVAAQGQVASAMIVGGFCAGLALATFVVSAILSARRGAPAAPAQARAPADPLVEAIVAAVGAQDRLARALTRSAGVSTPTRLVVLALTCGLALGGLLGQRDAPKTGAPKA